jgi:signal peptidase I
MRRLSRFLLWCGLLLAVVIGVARAAAIRWFVVPEHDPYLEASVAPTLRGGDLVILWRATKPTFGDLVVCPEPGAPERIVIGRIVGEAGDKVTINESNVFVNDSAPRSERSCTEPEFTVRDPNVGVDVKQRCQIENLNGRLHQRGSAAGHKVQPLKVTRDIEADRVFLLSDNRLFPYDSRDYGTVERASCKESVLFRLMGRKGFKDVVSRFSFIN